MHKVASEIKILLLLSKQSALNNLKQRSHTLYAMEPQQAENKGSILPTVFLPFGILTFLLTLAS